MKYLALLIGATCAQYMALYKRAARCTKTKDLTKANEKEKKKEREEEGRIRGWRGERLLSMARSATAGGETKPGLRCVRRLLEVGRHAVVISTRATRFGLACSGVWKIAIKKRELVRGTWRGRGIHSQPRVTFTDPTKSWRAAAWESSSARLSRRFRVQQPRGFKEEGCRLKN